LRISSIFSRCIYVFDLDLREGGGRIVDLFGRGLVLFCLNAVRRRLGESQRSGERKYDRRDNTTRLIRKLIRRIFKLDPLRFRLQRSNTITHYEPCDPEGDDFRDGPACGLRLATVERPMEGRRFASL
jgi:hypothetical protein